ncbi:DUF3047 domain-containing protein [Balneatrix alpica]|uniref:DUF3047 domain-containing protein n=1 Tax=Balneatrix alpica TaxID=75684 RepID=UPI002739D7B2|nr:DUF3047 domain-containing protein [Balneatrix alpica]
MKAQVGYIGGMVLMLTGSVGAQAEVLDFADLSLWQTQRFSGQTVYQTRQQAEGWVLEAQANASASGLLRSINLASETQPRLRWRWKVDNLPIKGAELSKAGDDFPARVYVVAEGFFPWQTLALNYVWASEQPQYSHWLSPYTKQACLIALESGQANLQQWQQYERDLVADFQRCFAKVPKRFSHIAVMTDTDNGGGQARAWYGPIELFLMMP